MGELLASGELLAGYVLPLGADGGEAGVALELGGDVGDVELVGQGHCLAVDLATADDEVLLCGVAEGYRLVERGGHLAPLDAERGVAGDDDVASAGQGSAYRLVGLAPHNHRLAHRHLLEVAEILWQVPRHRVRRAYRIIARNGNYYANHIVVWLISTLCKVTQRLDICKSSIVINMKS